MTSSKYLITHQPPGGSVTNITDAVRLSEYEGIKATTDSFAFSLLALPKYDNFFDDGDNIKIYFASGAGAFSLVMDGFVKEIELAISADRRLWTISGQNRLEVLLNAPLPSAYTSGGSLNTSAKIIQNLINLANSKWIKSKYSPTITATLGADYIDNTTTRNPTALKAINYYRVDTPVFQQMEELSTPMYTGADANSVGNYIFYLDSGNNFVWRPRPTGTSSTFNVGDFIEAKIEKVLFDVINFAIIDAGVDLTGKAIKTYAYNSTGMTRGFRARYFAKPELSNNLRRGVTETTPFGTAAASGFADNAAFRTRVRDDAKAWGKSVVGTFGQPRYKATLTTKGTTAYSKGNLYTIAIPGIFKDVLDNFTSSIGLRLVDIEQSFTSRGWTTDLKFEQDEITISGGAT